MPPGGLEYVLHILCFLTVFEYASTVVDTMHEVGQNGRNMLKFQRTTGQKWKKMLKQQTTVSLLMKIYFRWILFDIYNYMSWAVIFMSHSNTHELLKVYVDI